MDRCSAPKHIPHRTKADVVSKVLALRHKRMVAWAIARELELPRAGRALRASCAG
jgi:hypothetical protein